MVESEEEMWYGLRGDRDVVWLQVKKRCGMV
jgi:hypothetical protein